VAELKSHSVIGLIAAIACLLAASSVAGSAAAPTATQAPVLSYGVICGGGNGGSTLDPSQQGCAVAAIDTFTLDMLENIAPNGRLTPGLATSVAHPNAFVYIYHLRKGVTFSDGSALTAADVANAVNWARYPGHLTTGWYSSVREAKATNPLTVQFTLKRPDASFRYSMAIGNAGARVFEARQQQANKTSFGQPNFAPIGTGPYRLVRYDPTTGAQLAANPHYWGGTPPAKRLDVKFFKDEQSLALAFRAGDVDIAFPSDPTSFSATANVKVVNKPGCQPVFLAFKTNVAPFTDVHVRRAVAYAINRADIARAIGPQATPALTVIASSSLRSIASQAQIDALNKSLPYTQFSLAKAKQEMAKSKYPNGTSTYLAPNPFASFGARVTQVIAADLAKINIKLQVRSQTVAEWVADLLQGDASKNPPPALEYFACQDPDPALNSRFFAYSYGGKKTFDPPNYVNSQADSWIDLANKVASPAKRFAAYSQMLKIYASELPVVALVSLGPSLAVSSRFTFPAFSGYTSPDTPWIMGMKPK
jgi:peptide/nickel transport system substrate-binding protein